MGGSIRIAGLASSSGIWYLHKDILTGTDRAAQGGLTHHVSDSPAPGCPIVYSSVMMGTHQEMEGNLSHCKHSLPTFREMCKTQLS